MTIAKIAILGGLLTLLTGGSAAIVTKDKWWPSKSEESQTNGSTTSVPGASTGPGVGP